MAGGSAAGDGGRRALRRAHDAGAVCRSGEGDHWEISQLNEREAAPPNAYSQLAVLEWLVGTWQDKGGDQTVETKINWAGDKNFLVRTFKLKGIPMGDRWLGNYRVGSDKAANSMVNS